ncbi:hypothetical protein HUA74_32470 [Myxococcus sp. CA051A]|uniref:Quinol:cytochrome C oxidoreductase n=1 Tax=Myxococcus llanfairpwllgwyngyllgogerychwyrndrobwllllantysiliogogogochensis TaxID=2590453 RepID=A0A540WQU3_9BACT|nr:MULTISPECIES: hypothetical protein [Myxococcus]NTX00254.1 hypothetical protein [Myxococcus sp. CA040A]NTX15748.1 hypothetical protein [Myxococcus sp. CA056]NTX56646.1 hypothetical protein [Myxococcus sp. CA039A]NTX65383.1 hypothetical protein [Myxococcus sp. CA051A]TQF11372.1 hypothetical protein FJV41_34525 [Myxococcus llanfairpwllgwyngyllgogerychwyrndrobwllllantysiliogogogochensis]
MTPAAEASAPLERYTGTPKLMVPAFGLGALGLLATLAGFFASSDAYAKGAAAHSYLLAFVYWVGISVAFLIMVAIFHTAKAKWLIVLRRTMETGASAVPVFILLIIPVILMAGYLYPWWPGSPLRAAITGLESEHLSHKEHGYLNWKFTLVRHVIYFVVWAFAAWKLRGLSLKQDAEGGLDLTVRMRRFSPGILPFLALTITFASFDWLMSLTPLWQSTIFGVYYFAGSFLAAFCILTIATTNARGKDLYGNVVTPAHFHNLGKLMLAFTAFWAYIAFSQFMLVWIANIPEEAPWYGLRIFGAWKPMSIALFFGHFVLPFFVLLSRNLKLQPRKLSVVAVYLLAIHAVDLYWLIWPALTGTNGPTFHWTLITAFLGVGGIAVGFALMNARNNYTMPVKDPYIAESLRYVQP